ncbi:hypothetical protein OAC88_00285 [Flavobacteriaceae bacterium]|jgi:hypothetical protein|nr:hypothetical protein [Flavobacteriaceae bacterium]
MANIIPFAFRGELFSGTHNFANGGDAFKIALYTSNPYSTSSTVVLTTNEVSSAGSSNYERKALASQAVASSTAVASVDFADSTWASATFTAAFAAIYNDDKSDKLCVVLDFGGNKTATNGTFTVSYPDPSTPANAIISMA